MHGRESGRALVRPEVGSKYAPAYALPSQEFARATRRAGGWDRLRVAPLPRPLAAALGCAVILSWHIHAGVWLERISLGGKILRIVFIEERKWPRNFREGLARLERERWEGSSV